ncbi:MAG: prepilin peptidase, partial [Verrucomicrobiales bacterium]|nr:prepilin peptidase [Verrucomicrobiales bacterium]
ATYIDFDHFIIPDSITLGGVVAGLIASVAFPKLHDKTSHFEGLAMGALGAAGGFVLLWLIVRAGKLMFGRIRHESEEPMDFSISQPDPEDNPKIRIGEDEYDWMEVFYRKGDKLQVELTELKINDEARKVETFEVFEDWIEVNSERLKLEDVKNVSGQCTSAVVPREAMGFGDVKFIAMIGAFLGWEAVIFTVFAASIGGAIIGLLQKWVGGEKWSRPLPFGPYLALGAFVWIFSGDAIWNWYMNLLRSGWTG